MSSSSTPAVHPSFWRSSFDEHSGVVLAFLTSRVGRRELAEDLLQETFLRAMRAGALRDLSKVRSYLLSIAHRLVIDSVRKKRPVLFSEVAPDETFNEIEDRKSPLPDELAESGLMERRLREQIQNLSEPLRIAFQAAVVEQRSYSEIAAEQDWTVGQVRVNVHRARKKVIGSMRQQLQLDPGGQP